MSLSPAAIRRLAELGVSALDIADIAELNAPPVDVVAEKRRAFDRERKQAKRNSTGHSTGQPDDHSTGMSTGIPPETAALACVGDNNPSTEVPCDYTTPQNARPISSPPTKAELDSLEAALRAAAGSAINAAAPSLCQVSAILGLLSPKSGEPCDLEADVLPVLRAKAMQARPGRVSSWEFYRPAILEARDRRLQDAPAVVPIADYRRTRPPDDENAYREARQRALAGVGE